MMAADVGAILDGRACTAPSRVGYKFSRQCELKDAGFSVPEFFCVPVEAFDEAMAAVRRELPARPSAAELRPEAIEPWASAARAAVERVGVGDELAHSLLRAFDDLVGPRGRAAVRSCAVAQDGAAAEDSADDPFAGLGDSFLFVPRSELLQRVVACWASAFNAPAVLYRLRRGVDPAATRMAVGVQRMVRAARSFVAFTRDPRDGSRRCVIAAAYGLGEGVVREKADIDHFFVDPETGTIERRLTRKTKMVALDTSEALPSVQVVGVPSELAGEPVLDDHLVRRVAQTATEVAAHFGCPQDVEGAITEEGDVLVVQARPTSPAQTKKAEAPGAPCLWSSGNISESYTGVTSALTYSLARELYAIGFEGLYRAAGVPDGVLRRQRHELRRMVGYLDGRVYLRLETWRKLHGMLPGFTRLQRTWDRAMAAGNDPTGAAASSVARTAQDLAWLTALLVRDRARSRAFFSWWNRQYAALVDRGPRSAPTLVQDYRSLWDEVACRWGVALVNNLYLLIESSLAEHLMARWAPGLGRSTFNALLCDGPENMSVAALRSAIGLAECLGASKPAREAVLAGDDRRAWQGIVGGTFGEVIARAAGEHMYRYADRGLHDLKLEVKTFRQEPWRLVGLLRALIQQGRTVAESIEGERAIRRRGEAELRAACASHQMYLLGHLFRSIRRRTQIREDLRFCRSQLFGLSRQMLLEIGAHLTEASRLDSAEDVFDLTVDEVLGAYEGTTIDGDLRSLAGLRRKQRESSLSRPDPPQQVATDSNLPVAVRATGASAAVPPGETAGAALSGLGSSGGRVRARAKVVTRPDISAEECRDKILVAYDTDPGWLFLMLAAKGLVAERGTLVSHMAISGRIFGIPTVVAVEGAMNRICDGAWVELDGDNGTVRVVEEGAP